MRLFNREFALVGHTTSPIHVTCYTACSRAMWDRVTYTYNAGVSQSLSPGNVWRQVLDAL